MATYSNNTTIKINGGISASGSAYAGTTNVYTCPANSYAILTWYCEGDSSNWYIQVNGVNITRGVYQRAPEVTSGTASYTPQNVIYLGPGQTISIRNFQFNNQALNVTGVLFTNTP